MNRFISKKKAFPVLLVFCIIIIMLVAATYEKPIMVNYYGEKADLRQLESRIEDLGCDDHLGECILTCYNTPEEMLAVNNCEFGTNRGEIICEP